MQEHNIPCKGAHTFNGKVPTVNDRQLIKSACDCGRFVLDIQPCGPCGGKKDKVILSPNPNFKYAASK